MTLSYVSVLQQKSWVVLYDTRAMKNRANMIFLLFAALSRATMAKGKTIKETSVSIFITAT